MHVAAVVLAGGSGTRVGADRNKVYLPLAGRSIISWSLATMSGLAEVTRLILVVRPADRPLVADLLATELPEIDVELVDGGALRQDSEWQALRHLGADIRAGDIDVVLIHDGARPLATPALCRAVIATAGTHGGAIPGVPAADLVRVDPAGRGEALAGRHIRVQTPQAFAAAPLLTAYETAAGAGYAATDTAGCVQHYTDLDVHWVRSSRDNIKVTTPGDLGRAEALLQVAAEPLQDRIESGHPMAGQPGP